MRSSRTDASRHRGAGIFELPYQGITRLQLRKRDSKSVGNEGTDKANAPVSASNPFAEKLARALYDDLEKNRSVQRFCAPGSPEYRTYQKRIDGILLELRRRSEPQQQSEKRVLRRKGPVTPKARVGNPKLRVPVRRLKGIVESLSAARRMEEYLESKGIGQTEFAIRVGITDRTLRKFRRTGKVRRDIFEGIAKAMGMTKEEFLKHE